MSLPDTMTSRPSTAAPILAVLAIVLVTLGAYVGGYFWLGKRSDFYGHDNFLLPPDRIEREYRQQWEAVVFHPATKLESWARSVPVKAKAMMQR